MKAWACAQDFFCHYGGWLLVVAPTPGKARQVYMKLGPWEVESFADIRVRRSIRHDGMADDVSVYVENDDIPKGFPPFYTDEEEG
jgi:hypothetical protein